MLLATLHGGDIKMCRNDTKTDMCTEQLQNKLPSYPKFGPNFDVLGRHFFRDGPQNF